MYSLTPVARFELKLNSWQPIYLTVEQVFDIKATYAASKWREEMGKPNEWIISNQDGYYIESYVPYSHEVEQMMMIYFHPEGGGTVVTVHIDNEDIEAFIEDCQKIIDSGWKLFLDNRPPMS